jgi:hypothetical protein
VLLLDDELMMFPGQFLLCEQGSAMKLAFYVYILSLHWWCLPMLQIELRVQFLVLRWKVLSYLIAQGHCVPRCLGNFDLWSSIWYMILQLCSLLEAPMIHNIMLAAVYPRHILSLVEVYRVFFHLKGLINEYTK